MFFSPGPAQRLKRSKVGFSLLLGVLDPPGPDESNFRPLPVLELAGGQPDEHGHGAELFIQLQGLFCGLNGHFEVAEAVEELGFVSQKRG